MTDITPRPFKGIQDLQRIMQTVGQWTAQTKFGVYLHPGDVAHFVTNGMRKDRRNENVQIVEDEYGQIIGVMLLYPPRYKTFVVMVHPHHRGAFADALIGWTEAQLIAEQRKRGIEADELLSDMQDCDPQRVALLTARGYVKDAPTYLHFSCSPNSS